MRTRKPKQRARKRKPLAIDADVVRAPLKPNQVAHSKCACTALHKLPASATQSYSGCRGDALPLSLSVGRRGVQQSNRPPTFTRYWRAPSRCRANFETASRPATVSTSLKSNCFVLRRMQDVYVSTAKPTHSAHAERPAQSANSFFMDKTCHGPAVSDCALFPFFSFLSACGEVSIKPPASKLHYPYFFSDILVVWFVLLCAERLLCWPAMPPIAPVRSLRRGRTRRCRTTQRTSVRKQSVNA
jgi:hypothetical protein